MIEGQLRCQELSEHLKKIGAPNSVFLSEDGSGIVKKIVYDVKSNQLVGIVPPLDPINGSPKIFSYMANSEEEIRKFFELPQSSLVYIIVAQPLLRHAPPFILQIFGTDNKFKATDVQARWRNIRNELKK